MVLIFNLSFLIRVRNSFLWLRTFVIYENALLANTSICNPPCFALWDMICVLLILIQLLVIC